MQNKLYVGGIPYRLSEEEFQTAFEECGTVISAKIITDRETGRSRGFGFIEMESEEEAQNAIQQMDGAELGDRTIRVMIARPKEERRPANDNDDSFANAA